MINVPAREHWKKVYAAAHFGCLASVFAMYLAPVIAVGSAPPGTRLRAGAVGFAIAVGFGIICAVVANIAARWSD